MRILKRNNGQFTPMAAMIAFSMVMFMIAMVNVYKVSRAKLRVQNLADAAALNLASQVAQAFNIVADRNEWLNHMLAGVPSPSDDNAPPQIRDCSVFNMGNPTAIPGISCAENPFAGDFPGPRDDRIFSRHIFASRDGAINYASVVQSVNQAQQLFVQAYNSFLGVPGSGTPSSSATAPPTNLQGLLENDIPAFKDSTIHLTIWNAGNGPTVQSAVNFANGNQKTNSSLMQPLMFKVDHDIMIAYKINRGRLRKATLGQVLFGRTNDSTGGSQYGQNGPLWNGGRIDPVGWLVPANGMPQLNVSNPTQGTRYGVGVMVTQNVTLPIIGTKVVVAKAKAYVVEGSGKIAAVGRTAINTPVPRFKPTYWIKLAN
jgi:hypothetical protein